MNKITLLLILILTLNCSNDSVKYTKNEISNCIVKTIEMDSFNLNMDYYINTDKQSYYVIRNDFSHYLKNKKIYDKEIKFIDRILKTEKHIFEINNIDFNKDTCRIMISYYFKLNKHIYFSKFVKKNLRIEKIEERVGVV